MKKLPANPDFHKNNRETLLKSLSHNSVAIIVANDQLNRNGDQDFPYRQSSDLFYLSGIDQEKTVLALCPDHPDENLREVLFVVKPEPVLETWTGHKLTVDEVKQISKIRTVKWIDDMEISLRDMILSSENIYVNLNEYVKYQNPVAYSANRFAGELREAYPAHQFKRLAPILTEQRLVKQTYEIERMQEACDITGAAFERVLKFVKPGVYEYEVEAEITYEYLYRGARGHAYQAIVGSGKNALVLHYIENNDECKAGDLLLMDFGAEYGNYAADCSRTIPVSGKFTPRQKACYEAVLRVQKEATALFTPGNTIDKINKAVWVMMEKEMIGLGLFTKADVDNQYPANPLFFKYLMHGVTHFIGLDVHDVGSKYRKLKKGMVLTLEPGIYIKEENIGIRIENNIVVEDIPFDLMANIPREVEEIEELMNQ
ncbi:MAG TPA: aminopeptidase P N-terminal domain-containing protein [Bacteroidales bacterium]|nr:aminopeptidase P N-terminal domain-containing protein [Bacteroidales bacterium]